MAGGERRRDGERDERQAETKMIPYFCTVEAGGLLLAFFVPRSHRASEHSCFCRGGPRVVERDEVWCFEITLSIRLRHVCVV